MSDPITIYMTIPALIGRCSVFIDPPRPDFAFNREFATAEQAADYARGLAKTRLGTACQSPALRGKHRRRMHGGTNPGALRGNQKVLKHGLRTNDMRELRRLLRASGL